MPRQARRGGGGGGSGRQSSSAGDPYGAILESIQSSDSILENVSRVLMESTDYFSAEDVENLKSDVLSLANANVQMKHTVDYTKRNLNDMNPDGDLPAKEAVKKMKSDIITLSKTDTSTSKYVKQIEKLLQIGGEDEEEEDIVMMESKDTEANFLCPYTTKMIDVPMMHDTCKHVISETGLNDLLRRVSIARCPVAGCDADWKRGFFKVDKEFQKRMKRFIRVQQETGGSEYLTQKTVEMIDDDDDEYTQI